MKNLKKDKILALIVLIISIILIVYGFVTPGLFPFALPACIVGGFLFGVSLPYLLS